jgi:CheY-like chemotaxis protein
MRKKVIAIFEDDQISRFIYKRLFSRRDDVEAYIFESPEEGFAVAKETRFDIVFIEIHYWNNFGGIVILDKLKELVDPATSFVGMTSLLQRGDLEFLTRKGFTVVLEKPVVFSEKDLSMA